MINDFKKGEVVLIYFKEQNSKNVIEINGIIKKISKGHIKICHNFSGKKIIDCTIIPIKHIKNIEKINPIIIRKFNEIQ